MNLHILHYSNKVHLSTTPSFTRPTKIPLQSTRTYFIVVDDRLHALMSFNMSATTGVSWTRTVYGILLLISDSVFNNFVSFFERISTSDGFLTSDARSLTTLGRKVDTSSTTMIPRCRMSTDSAPTTHRRDRTPLLSDLSPTTVKP